MFCILKLKHSSAKSQNGPQQIIEELFGGHLLCQCPEWEWLPAFLRCPSEDSVEIRFPAASRGSGRNRLTGGHEANGAERQMKRVSVSVWATDGRDGTDGSRSGAASFFTTKYTKHTKGGGEVLTRIHSDGHGCTRPVATVCDRRPLGTALTERRYKRCVQPRCFRRHGGGDFDANDTNCSGSNLDGYGFRLAGASDMLKHELQPTWASAPTVPPAKSKHPGLGVGFGRSHAVRCVLVTGEEYTNDAPVPRLRDTKKRP